MSPQPSPLPSSKDICRPSTTWKVDVAISRQCRFHFLCTTRERGIENFHLDIASKHCRKHCTAQKNTKQNTWRENKTVHIFVLAFCLNLKFPLARNSDEFWHDDTLFLRTEIININNNNERWRRGMRGSSNTAINGRASVRSQLDHHLINNTLVHICDFRCIHSALTLRPVEFGQNCDLWSSTVFTALAIKKQQTTAINRSMYIHLTIRQCYEPDSCRKYFSFFRSFGWNDKW